MIKKIEKNLRLIITLAFAGMLMGWFFLEPTSGAVSMAAEVSSMISCTSPLTANNFGAIDNVAIYNATTSSTTVSSNGAVYMKVYDSGDGAANPGLYKNPDLIRSPNYAMAATATLPIGTEGYGIMAATNTSASAGALVISRNYFYASTTNIAGGIPYGAGAAKTVASSSASVSSGVIWVTYAVAVSGTTTAGAYTDTVTYSCSGS
jgi:hypothetical protein